MNSKLNPTRRLWQLEPNLTLPGNIRQAVQYYRKKYGENFTVVAMRPEIRKQIRADVCSGLKIVAETRIPPGCIFFILDGKVDEASNPG